MSGTRFSFRRRPGGFDAHLTGTVGATGAPIKLATASGKTKAQAIAEAADIAIRIASNPAMAAMLPPGTLAALLVARKLGQSALAGKARRYLKTIGGPGGNRLRRALGV